MPTPTVSADEASEREETPAVPVRPHERLVALDFIRGISVLGILFANITGFAQPRLAYFWPGALPGGGEPADRAIWLVQFVLVDGKFRGLFSLLFGAGMVLFVERMRERGLSPGLQLRRLGLLALFGLAHFYLLFTGDILFLYAVAGAVALGLVDMAPRRQFWLGVLWYLALTTLQALLFVSPAAYEAMPALRAASPGEWADIVVGWQAQIDSVGAERAVMAGGSYADIVRDRWETQSGLLYAYVYLAMLDTVPMMLAGMGLYRLGLFSGTIDPRRLRRWGWAGIALGTAATVPLGLWVMRSGFAPQLTIFVYEGAAAPVRLPMVLGLAALLAAGARSASVGWLGTRLVAAGRMAFSNYIGTSLVMALVFQGWAGGLYGTLDRVQLLVFVVLGWLAMLAWSKPWLERFAYGPLEWFWRCLTYGRWFPLRRPMSP